MELIIDDRQDKLSVSEELIEKIKDILGIDCKICLDRRENTECVYINFSSK